MNPIYEIELKYLVEPVNIISSKVTKTEIYSQQKFYNEFCEKYHTYTWIYTDGSVDPILNTLGMGVHIPSLEYNFSAKLFSHTQICNDEIIAINKAVSICIEKNINKAIIFTDSQSAIQKINNKTLKVVNGCSGMTKRLILEAKNINLDIIIAWIPGHSGVLGNIKADSLANVGRCLNCPVNIKVEKDDLFLYKHSVITWVFHYTYLRQQHGIV
uniref:ribonuclease H n=1 Tax=Diabrotica virgifera virgifera TaxID=50390 RepID=A0A6P7FUW1_DIAVI